MEKQPFDAARRAAKLRRTLQKGDDEIAKGAATLVALKKKRDRIAEDEEKREALDSEDFDAAMLKSEQLAYLRKKRKNFKMPRKVNATVPPPIEYVVFQTIYDQWIKDKKSPKGVVVDYAVLMRKTGRKKRQVVEYLLDLMAQNHLVRLGGGKGRANRLSVIPAMFPVAVKDDGNFRYTGQEV